MLKVSKSIIYVLMLFLINVNFICAKSTLAAEVESEKVAVYRTTIASNPLCAKVSEHAKYIGIAGFTAGFALIIGSIFFLNPATWYVALGMFLAGMAAIAFAAAKAAPFFACNWSFVRHPIMRFDTHDAKRNGNTEGSYKECEEPTKNYPDCTNRDFGSEEEYFRCLVTGDKDSTKPVSINNAKQNEPVCASQKFKKVDKYYWPKNRISSSNYIEVCYRNPIGSLNPITMIKRASEASSGNVTELLKKGEYPREGDYSTQEIKVAKYAMQGEVKCEVLQAGQEKVIHTITFQAVEKADKLCVYATKSIGIPLWPQVEIGCHMRPSGPPVPMCEKSTPVMSDDNKRIVSYDNSKCYSCYIDPACRGEVGPHIKSVFPMTSIIVSCIKGSLSNILTGQCGQNASKKVGFLKVAQDKLKKAVMAVLVLALILFAIKAALGGIQSPAELYMLIIKFALVVYFTQGSAMSHYYDQIVKLSIGLSDMVLQAGGSQTICDYSQSDYEDKYKYIAPWDRLDCRVLFYLGQQVNGGAATIVLGVLLSAGLFFATMLFNMKLMLCLIAIFAVIMLLLIMIWLVYIFLLSLIALTILILISPLMIPMVLFQATKGFFDGWIRQLMVYTLYPVILFAFLALLFTVFDNLYFEDLKFKRKEVNVLGQKRITFTLNDPRECDDPKYDNNLACMFGNIEFITKPAFFGFNAYAPDFKHGAEMLWMKLLMMVLIGFLFYHFLSSIAYIAAELAGDPRAGHVGSSFTPKSMLASIVGLAAKVQGSVGEQAKKAITDKLDDRKKSASDGGGKDELSGGSSEGAGDAAEGAGGGAGGSGAASGGGG
ncbi:trbL/VirB6 plasmid conjugal transfer family protein [Ehrlichia chaffeensis str. Liberty]|uniref:VirB6 n=1 Tax=Ehrlichia chaffeensis TaxID=945 RepID=Q8RPN1_EHRCH|nr:type IV secretion system protein [Ehrlichia chaffeensis]AAM00403.1 VirB6 [Ehrlichia chaffeensis]AHX05686.1 trbL/VirB6 plasmid conjugal transfer family protein [Ehrlichia chaffeensis str. Jax]AHX06678.1 trbL/VirB6 plasmid conjugal transfer family protein [Ehrlichia chaffeensis str. Liberty]